MSHQWMLRLRWGRRRKREDVLYAVMWCYFRLLSFAPGLLLPTPPPFPPPASFSLLVLRLIWISHFVHSFLRCSSSSLTPGVCVCVCETKSSPKMCHLIITTVFEVPDMQSSSRHFFFPHSNLIEDSPFHSYFIPNLGDLAVEKVAIGNGLESSDRRPYTRTGVTPLACV